LARGYKKRYGDLLQYDVEEEISAFNVSSRAPMPSMKVTNLFLSAGVPDNPSPIRN
jgi:hypothetical protein